MSFWGVVWKDIGCNKEVRIAQFGHPVELTRLCGQSNHNVAVLIGLDQPIGEPLILMV